MTTTPVIPSEDEGVSADEGEEEMEVDQEDEIEVDTGIISKRLVLPEFKGVLSIIPSQAPRRHCQRRKKLILKEDGNSVTRMLSRSDKFLH